MMKATTRTLVATVGARLRAHSPRDVGSAAPGLSLAGAGCEPLAAASVRPDMATHSSLAEGLEKLELAIERHHLPASEQPHPGSAGMPAALRDVGCRVLAPDRSRSAFWDGSSTRRDNTLVYKGPDCTGEPIMTATFVFGTTSEAAAGLCEALGGRVRSTSLGEEGCTGPVVDRLYFCELPAATSAGKTIRVAGTAVADRPGAVPVAPAAADVLRPVELSSALAPAGDDSIPMPRVSGGGPRRAVLLVCAALVCTGAVWLVASAAKKRAG